jgi:hypothetical protein
MLRRDVRREVDEQTKATHQVLCSEIEQHW